MIVRTVLGDIPPDRLGVTYAHEHLIIDSPLVAERWPHIHLPSVNEAVAEVALCAEAGVVSMVDAMPTGSGRDMARLAEVSRITGVNVVAATGMHTMKYYEGVDWSDDPPDRLAVRFIAEVLEGADGTGARAGVMKIATTGEHATTQERRLFQAAGQVHAETGVPLITHCEQGEGGLAQIDLLESEGVALDKVILSHTDKATDPGYHRAMLDRGVNLVYDQALRPGGAPATADLVEAMWDSGHGARILLGTDGARRDLWESLGGEPGLAWLATGFPRLLADRGLGSEQIEAMFVTNPARVLAFQPPR